MTCHTLPAAATRPTVTRTGIVDLPTFVGDPPSGSAGPAAAFPPTDAAGRLFTPRFDRPSARWWIPAWGTGLCSKSGFAVTVGNVSTDSALGSAELSPQQLSYQHPKVALYLEAYTPLVEQWFHALRACPALTELRATAQTRDVLGNVERLESLFRSIVDDLFDQGGAVLEHALAVVSEHRDAVVWTNQMCHGPEPTLVELAASLRHKFKAEHQPRADGGARSACSPRSRTGGTRWGLPVLLWRRPCVGAPSCWPASPCCTTSRRWRGCAT